MKCFKVTVLFLGLIGGLGWHSFRALAQTSRGTVSGTVLDPSGASVPGATVQLVNGQAGTKRDTKTNSSGLYRFDAVDLATYDVIANAPGFREILKKSVDVQANLVTTIDFQLELGGGTTVIQVEAASAQLLQTSEPVRGGNFEPVSILQLPLQSRDSLNFILLVPGAQNASTTQFSNGSNNYSINGQRARSNNFLIDGVENNDISIAGPAFQITNNDLVQEVSVQTTQFSAEFGRAGGAVVNQITKSGTNAFHGTASETYISHVFNTTSNSQRLGRKPGQKIPPPFVENVPAFTVGGPIIRNKTFFFGGAQWDRFFASALGSNLRAPTEAGVAALQSLVTACPNAALYLKAIGSTRGNPGSSPSNISIAVPAALAGTTCNGNARAGVVVQTGLVSRSAAQHDLDNNHLIRIDHSLSDKQTMSFRWLYDRSSFAPTFNNFDGFDRGFDGITLTMAITHTYVLRSNWTNELRLNYGRIGFDFVGLAPDSFHSSLPNFDIAGVKGFGRAANMPQFRFANNWQLQNTMTLIKDRHTLRFGGDFLRQLARQHPPFNERGSFAYRATPGVTTALANFIDDIGGASGTVQRVFGESVYHPNLFRQAYFFQDTWKFSPNLTLELGARYENFGQPANVFRIPAFTNYDAVNFARPNRVNNDNNNFGPVFGFAWNPKYKSGILGSLFGDGRTVWRGGFQVTYDAFFNNLLSNIAGSSPNTLGGLITSFITPASPRGTPNWQSQFASITATPASPKDPQTSLLDPNIRNPYTERFSFGFQRQLPSNVLLDVSYVGSAGHKLFQTLDMNPFVAPKVRFHNDVGQRTMRASSANSIYHSLQASVRRRYSATPVGALLLEGSYTWSHYIDNISEVFATDSTQSAFQSLPQVLGFSRNKDRAVSDNDRRHRLAIDSVWNIRGPKSGLLGEVAGGWSLATVAQLVTGAPFTVSNGTDRNGDGLTAPDRPDIGNPNMPLNTRAVIVGPTKCASGFQNADTLACATPDSVHWLQGAGLPNANTVGRNTLRAPGFVQLDLTVSKEFRLSERFRLRYSDVITNLLNHQNFAISTLPVSVTDAGPGEFLDFHTQEAPGRTMRMNLKLIW